MLHFYYLPTDTQPIVDAQEKSYDIKLNKSQEESELQTTFLDTDPGHVYSVSSEPDKTFLTGHTPDLELDSFLSRKVKIAEYTFQTSSTPVTQVLLPWYLFFNTPAIKNKIENYAFLNCGMEIEFRINGAPSFYGKFMVSYEPLPSWRPTLPIPGPGGASLVEYSQRPHAYLTVEESQGATLNLPFIFHKNWLTLARSSEFQDMGAISLIPMTDIYTTNGDAGQINISVYAKATNVHLSGTTQDLVLQSGNVKVKKKGKSKPDEFKDAGPISGPAGVVANIAGMLANAPVIGPYARATEMLASGVGGMAKLFGFSRTPVLAEPIFTRPSPFGQMANTETSETVDRLVLDPKQGLTIDSRTVGLDGADEMTIKSIATRESYLTTISWGMNDPANTILWKSNVNPCLVRTSGSRTHMTPMAFASAPFNFWRGTIKFRFQLVASAYHRGRYQVQWDPLGGAFDPTGSIEAVTTTTIDISSDKDVEISIPFAQATSYAPVVRDFQTQYFGTNPSVMLDSNGLLTVSVLNELNTFGTSNAIFLLVHVSMGDDVEFCGPRDLSPSYQMTPANPAAAAKSTELVAQSGEVNIADPHLAGANAPVGAAESVQQVKVLDAPDHTSAIFFGEKIFSFRSLLKRYNKNFSMKYEADLVPDTSRVDLSTTFPRYPICKGHDSTGLNNLTSGRGNSTNLTLFNYLAGAYVGMRGGMRWKANVVSAHYSDSIVISRFQEARNTGEFDKITSYPVTDTYSAYMAAANGSNESFAGYALTNARTQAGLEIEAPYYSRFRFHTTDPTHTYKGYSYDTSSTDTLKLTIGISNPLLSPNKVTVDFHCATGEDFNFFMFLNAPPLFNYSM